MTVVPYRKIGLSTCRTQPLGVLGFRGLAPVRIDLVDPTLNPAKIAELSWPANFQR